MKYLYTALIIIGSIFLQGCLSQSASTSNDIEIFFFTNGGNDIDPQTYQKNEDIELPVPTKEGYDFVGWYQNVSLTETFHIDQESSDSVTLFAKWQPKTYHINFYVEDVLIKAIDYTFGDGKDSIIYPSPPTIEDHVFLKWTIDKNTLDLNQDYDVHGQYMRVIDRDVEQVTYRLNKEIIYENFLVVFSGYYDYVGVYSSIDIYQLDDPSYHRQISVDESTIGLYYETMLKVVDGKIFLPYYHIDDQVNGIAVYDLYDPGYKKTIHIESQERRIFYDYALLLSEDYILVQTQADDTKFIDLYDMKTFEFVMNVAEYQTNIVVFDAPLSQVFDGNMVFVDHQLIIGTIDVVDAYGAPLMVDLQTKEVSLIEDLYRRQSQTECLLMETVDNYYISQFYDGERQSFFYVIKDRLTNHEQTISLTDMADYQGMTDDYFVYTNQSQVDGIHIGHMGDGEDYFIEKPDDARFITYYDLISDHQNNYLLYTISKDNQRQLMLASSENGFESTQLLVSEDIQGGDFLTFTSLIHQSHIYSLYALEESIYLVIHDLIDPSIFYEVRLDFIESVHGVTMSMSNNHLFIYQDEMIYFLDLS